MAASTFRDHLAKRNRFLHARAVWEELAEHLGKFLDTDSTKAKVGISTDGEGMTVPQEIIQEVRDNVEVGIIAPLQKNIDTIDNRKVAENADDKKKKQTSAEAKGSKSPARGRKVSKARAARKKSGAAAAKKGNTRRSPRRAANAPESDSDA